MLNLQNTCEQVLNLVNKTSSFIASEYGKVGANEIETKDHNSLVSYVDKTAEEILVEGLSSIIPGCGFITEEDTVDQIEEYTWIIDPLDGTTNFLYNIPHFSVSVALQHKGELVLGVVADVMRKENYYAWKGGGAFMNGKAISVSPRTKFSECIIATGFPYESFYDKKPYFAMMEKVMNHARGLRRFGSAALDMAYVSNGRFDAFYETSINAWDVAAGIIICREAGAVLSDYHGGDKYYTGSTIIVANPSIQKIIVEHTKEFFPFA